MTPAQLLRHAGLDDEAALLASGQKGAYGSGTAVSIGDPLDTVTTRDRFGLVAPYLVKYHAGVGRTGFRGQSLEAPIRTIDTSNRFGLIAPFLAPVNHQGDDRVHSVREPVRTITCAPRGEHALFAPVIVRHNGGEHGHQAAPRDITAPLGAVTTKNQDSLAAAWFTKFYGTATAGSSARAPLPTVTTGGGRGGGHIAAVQAFLRKHSKRAAQRSLFDDEPGVVMIDGEPHQISDVTMRMLLPEELKRAMGFLDSYIIDPLFRGKPMTKTAQTELIGNSVCPPMAEALVAANTRAPGWRATA